MTDDLPSLPEFPVAVIYPDTGIRNDPQALALWMEFGYDTGGTPLFNENQLRYYGRLCRAAAEQAGKVEGSRLDAMIEHGMGSVDWAKPTQPAAPDLPGMWEASDFTGGDPDERCHSERAVMQQPVAWVNPKHLVNLHAVPQMDRTIMTTPLSASQAADRTTPLFAAPVSPSREVEALDPIINEIALMAVVNAKEFPDAAAKLSNIAERLQAIYSLRKLAPVQEKAP